jgi:G3E family GTPase
VLTKTDLADSATTARLTHRLRELNPRAAVDVAVAGALDAARFVAPANNDHPAQSGFVAEAVHGDAIASFVIMEHAPIDWTAFARTMETLTALRGPDLLRAKGLLNVAGCRGPVVVQFVQHLAHPPAELQSWPSEDRSSRLVFITRNISENTVRDLWAATRALITEASP